MARDSRPVLRAVVGVRLALEVGRHRWRHLVAGLGRPWMDRSLAGVAGLSLCGLAGVAGMSLCGLAGVAGMSLCGLAGVTGISLWRLAWWGRCLRGAGRWGRAPLRMVSLVCGRRTPRAPVRRRRCVPLLGRLFAMLVRRVRRHDPLPRNDVLMPSWFRACATRPPVRTVKHVGSWKYGVRQDRKSVV